MCNLQIRSKTGIIFPQIIQFIDEYVLNFISGPFSFFLSFNVDFGILNKNKRNNEKEN